MIADIILGLKQRAERRRRESWIALGLSIGFLAMTLLAIATVPNLGTRLYSLSDAAETETGPLRQAYLNRLDALHEAFPVADFPSMAGIIASERNHVSSLNFARIRLYDMGASLQPKVLQMQNSGERGRVIDAFSTRPDLMSGTIFEDEKTRLNTPRVDWLSSTLFSSFILIVAVAISALLLNLYRHNVRLASYYEAFATFLELRTEAGAIRKEEILAWLTPISLTTGVALESSEFDFLKTAVGVAERMGGPPPPMGGASPPR